MTSFSLIIKFSFCASPKHFWNATGFNSSFYVAQKFGPVQNIHGPRRARCKIVHRAVPILWAHLCVLRTFDLIIIIILRHSTGSSECQKIWWGQAYLVGMICSPLGFCFYPRRHIARASSRQGSQTTPLHVSLVDKRVDQSQSEH